MPDPVRQLAVITQQQQPRGAQGITAVTPLAAEQMQRSFQQTLFGQRAQGISIAGETRRLAGQPQAFAHAVRQEGMGDQDARHVFFIHAGHDKIRRGFPEQLQPALQHQVDLTARLGQGFVVQRLK